MRIVNLGNDIVFPVMDRMGYDPVLDFTSQLQNELTGYVNAWVRKTWDAADWPELSAIQPRTPAAHLVSYDPSGPSSGSQTPIGRVLKVYVVDPTLNQGPFDVPFSLEQASIHVGYDHGTQVWIKFMTRPTVYTLVLWNSATTYGFGALVFDAASGNCYQSLAPSNTNNPVTNTTWWAALQFPYVIAEPVWRGAYSDMLRADGQTAKAQVEEQAAMQELQASIQRNSSTRYDKLTDQQTGTPRSQDAPLAPAA